MNKVTKRWITMNKVLIVVIGLIILFAWMDTQQLITMKAIDKQWGIYDVNYQRGSTLWDLFWNIQQPAIFLMWMGVLLAIAIIWYIIYKDKSEALALFLTPAVLIWFGSQDLIYYILSPIDNINLTMGCWANRIMPVNILSQIFGMQCPNNFVFLASGFMGFLIAGFIYTKLQAYKPRKG